MKQHHQITILSLNPNKYIIISAVSSSHRVIPNDFKLKKKKFHQSAFMQYIASPLPEQL